MLVRVALVAQLLPALLVAVGNVRHRLQSYEKSPFLCPIAKRNRGNYNSVDSSTNIVTYASKKVHDAICHKSNAREP